MSGLRLTPPSFLYISLQECEVFNSSHARTANVQTPLSSQFMMVSSKLNVSCFLRTVTLQAACILWSLKIHGHIVFYRLWKIKMARMRQHILEEKCCVFSVHNTESLIGFQGISALKSYQGRHAFLKKKKKHDTFYFVSFRRNWV